ncbi:12929_t:CDS:10 [Acaulospora colombiana]|uniref:12929_t:CDS:1 n=1 Tax=Acaulospora colombiana TaxID=27376 RepID=A0ACA9MIU3_9GLOM|nr:12929_t:CDS:10 [Acaulospora colombiana]
MPHLRHGLATITTIDAEDIKAGLALAITVDSKDVKKVDPEMRTETMVANGIMNAKREYYVKNYYKQINFELLEGILEFPLSILHDLRSIESSLSFSRFSILARRIGTEDFSSTFQRLLKHFKRVREQAAAKGIDVVSTNDVGYDLTTDLECRLHSLDDGLGDFAPFFEGKKWHKIIKMNNQDLMDLGIRSEIIRKKLIKGFKFSSVSGAIYDVAFVVKRLISGSNSVVIKQRFIKCYLTLIQQVNAESLYEKNRAIYERNKGYYEDNYIIKTNFELLEDFPTWLSGLGLKSLSPYFEGKNWKVIIKLEEQDLEEMGISNINHKKRLIRHFQRVQQDLTDHENILSLDENVEENCSMAGDVENFKVDPSIREDIPCWLNSLGDGLGDYSHYFQGKKWYEIVDLTGQDLSELGVKKGNIRRQLLDGFLLYKGAMNNKEAEDILLRIKDYYWENYITKTNYELLEDFPAWLDGLGLKALAPRFEGRAWQDIIKMTSSDLEEIGIPTKGLRKRLIRHFVKIQNNLNTDDSITEEDKIERIRDSGNFYVDHEVIGDLTCWLHSIDDELGKIAPFFLDKKWQEVIDMGHKELLELGIRSRKMRQSLLEGFELYKRGIVAQKQGQPVESDFIRDKRREFSTVP